MLRVHDNDQAQLHSAESDKQFNLWYTLNYEWAGDPVAADDDCIESRR